MDVSSSTREMTVDLLWHCLTKVEFESAEKSKMFETQFVKKYLALIVERADDKNLGVRKKVVQILSYVLHMSDSEASSIS